MRASLFATAFAASLAVSAAAQTNLTTPTSGYSYFNRPGATAEQHFADLADCRDKIDGAIRLPATATYTPTFIYIPRTSTGASSAGAAGAGAAAAVGLGIIAAGAIDAAVQARRIYNADFENCMIVKGWRVAQVDETTGKELDTLDQSALAARLGPMVGANIPEGEVIRSFQNDAVHADTRMLAPPEAFDEVSLSVQALPDRVAISAQDRRAQETALRDHLRALGPRPQSAAPPRATQPRALASLPEGSAVLVIHVGGAMGNAVPNIVFERESTDDWPAWKADAQPDTIIATPGMRLFAPANNPITEATLIYAVPPGRWRLVGVQQGQYSASFCLGGPSFDIAAGDVVYAGAFYTDLRERGPDMNLAPAQAALANAPALLARLHSATFRNGDTGPCPGVGLIYAFEVPGAPFHDGYAWGSNVGAAATQAAVAAPPSDDGAPTATPATASADQAATSPTP